jgi:hypothetical protein
MTRPSSLSGEPTANEVLFGYAPDFGDMPPLTCLDVQSGPLLDLFNTESGRAIALRQADQFRLRHEAIKSQRHEDTQQ